MIGDTTYPVLFKHLIIKFYAYELEIPYSGKLLRVKTVADK